jgi:hypothetical protein
MTITLENLERLTLEQMREFVKGSRTLELAPAAEERAAAYKLIERVLKAQQYKRLPKTHKGIVRRFLMKVTRLSRAQVTRLVAQWMESRQVRARPPQRPEFTTRYTAADVGLLASVDAAHEDLSGPAVRRILQREYEVFSKSEFERLAGISVSHIYNLRNSQQYRRQRVRVQSTRSRQVSIAERRKPDPQGQPGYLRVDTVHQGHHDGKPGVYHINAVDTVTQWQVIGCVETISERHMIPVLEAMLHQFPFVIRNFHCDNGSEFINHTVAKLLNKLLVEFTKSRACRSTDNALVEGKNGAVVRKHIGYGPIASEHAEALQKFYTAHFNAYLNFHRPCGFATVNVDARGKKSRVYQSRDYRTPFEKLSSLEDWKQYLKAGVTVDQLRHQATRHSDTEAAQGMQKAKNALLSRMRGLKLGPL